MKSHLFEFEDQDWFPEVLRNYQTDYLGYLSELLNMYDAAKVKIESFRKPTDQMLVDLASGSGRPVILASENLRKKDVCIILSDKFPALSIIRRKALPKGVSYHEKSIDVLQDHFPKGDLYTMFNAFHHLNFRDQLALAQRIHEEGKTLLIFEPLQPNMSVFLKVFLITSIGPLLFAPFVKPFSWSRLLLTYLLPLGPLVTWWDGLVSVFRAPSVSHLKKFTAACSLAGIKSDFTFIRQGHFVLTCIKIE